MRRVPDQGEIWMVSLDPARGHEQRGFRPVFVLSQALFTRTTGIVIAAAITQGGDRARIAGFAAPLGGFGFKTQGAVVVSHVRELDFTERGARFVEATNDTIVDDVMARFGAIFS